MGLRALLYFAFTTVIAVTLGLVVSTLVKGWIPTIDLHVEKTGADLTLPEVTNLLESIMDLPDVQRVIHNAVLLHREKEEPPIGTVSSERYAD